MDEKEKSIDSSWKEAVEKEKAELKEPGDFIPPEADFNFFIHTLTIQAAIFLGQIPNPVNDQKEEDIPHAKFIIDTLAMLKEKTKGNLNKDEQDWLENSLYALRMQYIAKIKEVKND